MQMVALTQMVSVMILAGTVVYFSMKMSELQKLLIMREVHFSDKLDSLKNSFYEALALGKVDLEKESSPWLEPDKDEDEHAGSETSS